MQASSGRSRLTLRDATEGDLETIRGLASEIWRSVYSLMLPPGQIEYMLKSGYSREALVDGVVDKAARYALLCLEGVPRGFASLRTSDDRPEEVMLDKLYLHPVNHGAGHGSRALKLLEKMAREEMAGTGMCLRVNRANSKAIRAYLRGGYAVTGRICTEIGEGFVMDDYWMSKPLPSVTTVS